MLLYDVPVAGERTGISAHESDRDEGKMVHLFSQVTQNAGSPEKPVRNKIAQANFRKPLTL